MAEKKGKYGDLLNKAKSTSKPDSQIASSKEDKEVNLCIRVPQSQRQWWSGQAKLQGTTMTDVIKAALEDAFGMPPN